MPPKTRHHVRGRHHVYEAVVDALKRRDQIELRAVNALLSTAAPKAGRSRARATGKPTVKPTMRDAVTSGTGWTVRSVLCPIDFSEQSRLALSYASQVARYARAPLTVLYVNDPFLVAASAAALHDRTLAVRSERELLRFINATLSSRRGGRPAVKTAVSVGRPAGEILKAAARCRADLIVMGAHGLTGADRLLLGSITRDVLRRSPVPVLAVPSARGGVTPRQRRAWPGSRIVAALELDHRSRREAARFAEVARWFGASLLLAHVVEKVAAPPWIEADFRTYERIRVGKARTKLETLAASIRTLVKADARVLLGRPVDEIASLVASERIGLVVTALRDKRGWFGARRGSISYDVLSHVATPVLALPTGRARR